MSRIAVLRHQSESSEKITIHLRPLACHDGLIELTIEAPSMRRCAVLVVVLTVFGLSLLAQRSSSRLTIIVEDGSGAPITGASVEVQHWVGGQLIQDGVATTDAHGQVSFKRDSTAIYHVFASAQSFVPAAASVGNFGETGHVFKLTVGQGGGVRVESLPK